MSNSNTKSVLIFLTFAVIVFLVLPFLFLNRSRDKMDTVITSSPQLATSQQPIAANKTTSPEFKELESLLVSKGTGVCEILSTINTQKEENLKIAIEKFPTEDTQRGQHVMSLNQKSLDDIKTKYDIDRRVLSKVFRLGMPNCK